MIVDVNLNEYINNKQTLVEKELKTYFHNQEIPHELKESMLYSLQAGGKRLRPVLLFASYQIFKQDINPAISSAIALEMIHTYSLIHDDLPAMDDDTYRRGQLTNHKVFNEAVAILAGDALLTYSFELITNDPLLTEKQKVQIVQLLAQASGPKGMVGGQILDLEAENKSLELEGLEQVHTLKTGELLKFAISTGALLGGATKEQISELETFAYYLGLIFQVQDDILDITGDEKKIGKAVGSDEDNEKSTYPKLLVLDGTINNKNEYVQLAKKALKKAQADTSILMALTDYFSQRDH